MGFLFFIVLVGVVTGLWLTRAKRRQTSEHKTRVRREIYIDSYPFPGRVENKVRDTYPHLSAAQINQVMAGLRQYFQLCRLANKKNVAMPSQVVDVAWHEFILFTQNYEIFCKRAFGHFLHHVPAQAMKTKTDSQTGIKRAWRLACKLEKLNPDKPTRLPLIFSLDTELGIRDGFYYSLDCRANPSRKSNEFCVTDMGGGSGCGSDCSSGSSFLGATFGSWFSSDSDASSGSESSSSDSGSSDSGSSCSSGCSGCGGGGD